MTKDIPPEVANQFLTKENEYQIEDWYPTQLLIENSRISARPGMRVADVFTKRTLACHARLLSLIKKYSSGNEQDLLLLAFTANIANCSKLVPPIKSRGEIAQGAWMTGFYIGETYIENNVLHYFENRLRKVINGKEDFLNEMASNLFSSPNRNWYRITNVDAKNLNIADESVDYVFTDPPYGDSVPYLEQSILWNAWIQKTPRYDDEVVVSDSAVREKNIVAFSQDIHRAISEIRRVLKPNKFFSLTFHSLSGLEWRAVTNACIQNNFKVVSFEWLEQKTYPPRQLNRTKSIKGDVLVTFVKDTTETLGQVFDDQDLEAKIISHILGLLGQGINDTNSIMMSIMEWILRARILVGDVDIFKILNTHFIIDSDGRWYKAA